MKQLRFPPQGEFLKEALEGYRGLASAVIVAALKELKLFKDGKTKDKDGWKYRDPTPFLTAPTVWHELLGLDPEKVARYIEIPEKIDALYKSIKKNEQIYLNKGGGPGNMENMKIGAQRMRDKGRNPTTERRHQNRMKARSLE